MYPPFLADVRFKLVMAGERAGKSFTGGTYAAARFMHGYLTTRPHQLIWLVGKDYESCKPEFDEMAEQLVRLGLVDVKDIFVRDNGRDKCSFATTDGSLFVETITGADPQKVARLAPDGILGCEVAQWSEELFLRVVGRLAQKRGWLWASGSWEGSLGWLPAVWRRWHTANTDDGRSWAVPSWTNRLLFPGGEHDPEIERLRKLYPPGRFMERFGGEPCTPAGAVYADDLTPDRITFEAAYDPDEPVQVWIDPGYGGAYAVLAVQVHRTTVDVIDELYLREYTNEEVIAEARTRPWWSGVRYGVIDRAGAQHHAEQSAVEAWNNAGVRLSWRKVPIIDGIDRVRSFLRTGTGPQLRINPRCSGLIAEMGHGPMPYPDMKPYSYRVDAQTGVSRSDVPEMINNHSCSALAYGLVDNFGFIERIRGGAAPIAHGTRGPTYLDWSRDDGVMQNKLSRAMSDALRTMGGRA